MKGPFKIGDIRTGLFSVQGNWIEILDIDDEVVCTVQIGSIPALADPEYVTSMLRRGTEKALRIVELMNIGESAERMDVG